MDTATQIASFGFGILFVALAQATLFQGSPLKDLGIRPKGTGLFSYLFHYLINGGGVLGHDPILGAISPPLRLCCHVTAVVLLWSGVLLILPAVSVSLSGSIVCAFYLVVSFILHHVLPGASVPGGPRAQKIQRIPDWPDKTWQLDSSFRYAVAEESHEITHARSQQKLSGEPFGRDIWTTVPLSTKRVDEKVVQELASGGRDYTGFNPSVNPNSADRVFRAQLIREYLGSGGKPPSSSSQPVLSVEEATKKAVHFYSMLQTADGHWSGDYGGPHFLLPGLIVVWYIMGKPEGIFGGPNDEAIKLLQLYIRSHQQVDGGWGTHIESPSTMFGTALMYVALRLLGAEPEEDACKLGRRFLQENGGVLYTSSWAKFYLCLLGVMEWDGHNSTPPEMWLLPNWCPFHPGRMWCHARMVYLPMGYLYGVRYVYEKSSSDPVVQCLREELYCEPYDTIDWIRTRHLIAPMDNYSPIPFVMIIIQNILARYETWSIFQPLKNLVRHYGLEFSKDYMAAEDLQTNYIDIGPVNKVLNMLSAYDAAGRDIDASTVQSHLLRVPDYMWVAEDGMKMKGYNGSQCWDTSFAIQAIYEAGLLDEFPQVSKKVWGYLERCQILSTEVSQSTPAYSFECAENRLKYYRHVSEGGWPFSTSAHGWPITDCTGEGLKSVLCLRHSQCIKDGIDSGELLPISEARLQKSINVLLTYQNEDGGFSTYENNRGYGWFESLNPSEVFGDIMIDYSYVECSMASLTALVDFHEDFPSHRASEIRDAISRGQQFLKTVQRDDGSWYGSWACCFCYGTWFGIEGLVKCGEPLDSPCIIKACEFLISQQRPNGGWGEDFTSCYDKAYAQEGMKAYGDEGSGVVNTAWALMALACAKSKDVDAVRKGVQYLLKRQLPSGDWSQEGIAGVFNRACGITYTAYRNVFPIWAFGRCRMVYGDDVLNQVKQPQQ